MLNRKKKSEAIKANKTNKELGIRSWAAAGTDDMEALRDATTAYYKECERIKQKRLHDLYTDAPVTG